MPRDYKPCGEHVYFEEMAPAVRSKIKLAGQKEGQILASSRLKIVAVGPKVKQNEWGFEVGDEFVLAPNAYIVGIEHPDHEKGKRGVFFTLPNCVCSVVTGEPDLAPILQEDQSVAATSGVN